MSRLSVLGYEQLSPALRAQAPITEAAGGSPALIRVLAHRPDMLEAYFKFYFPLLDGGVLPPELKELVRLKVAEINQCVT